MKKLLLLLIFITEISFIKAQYIETFDIANKGILACPCSTSDPSSCANTDLTGVNWTIGGNLSGIDSEGFFTQNGYINVEDVDEEICWISPIINISAITFSSFTVDFTIPAGSAWEQSETLGSTDYMDVKYSVDGSSFITLANINGCPASGHTLSSSSCGFSITGPQDFVISESGIIGNEIEIQVCVDVNANSDEGYLKTITIPESGTTVCDGTSGLTFYVDNKATGNGAGLSWVNAYTSLQDALAVANACGAADSIKISCGTYYPDIGSAVTLGDREASFNIDVVTIIAGGYDPLSNQLNEFSQTILSGNINSKLLKTDNTKKIVKISQEALLFNLVIENAYNDDLQELNGAGIYATEGIFKNMIIRYNENASPSSLGGGMYATQNAIELENVLIHNNSAINYGGGISLDGIANAVSVLRNVTIADNSAGLDNGGIDNFNTTTEFFNTIVYNNAPSSINLFGSTLNASYSVIDSPTTWPGTGNSTKDPIFINNNQDNYRIAECGSAYNNGNTADGPTSGIDLDGNDRVKILGVDIGAYEVQRSDLRSQIASLPQGISLTYSCPKKVKVGIPNSQPNILYEFYSPALDGSIVGDGNDIIVESIDDAKDYNYFLFASRKGFSKLDFDSNKRITIPYDSEIALVSNEDYTVELKINLDDISGRKRIYSQEGAFSIAIDGDEIFFTEFGNFDFKTAGVDLIAGVDNDIKIKIEPTATAMSNVYVWVSGVLKFANSITFTGPTNTNEIHIGGRPSGEWMKASMDYLQIKKGNKVILRYDFVTGNNSTTVFDLRALEDGDSPRNGTMIGFNPVTDWIAGSDTESILCSPVGFVNVSTSTIPVNHIVTNSNDAGFETLRFQIEEAACPNDTIRFANLLDPIFVPDLISIKSDINIIGNGMNQTILNGENNDNRFFDLPFSYKILMKDFQMKDNIAAAFYITTDHTLENILYKNVFSSNFGTIGIDAASNVSVKGEVIIEE